MTTNAQKKNIPWINYLRGICILSVYFVHSNLYTCEYLSNVNLFIHPFYVNGFFFVSGYLLFRKQLSSPLIDTTLSEYAIGGGKQLTTNILYRLIIPSILFAFIEFLPKKLIRGQEFDISDMLWETIGGGTYWFTSALVIAQLVLCLMLLSRQKNIWLYWGTSIIMMFIGLFMVNRDMNFLGLSHDFWSFKRGLLALPFLTAGGLYRKYEQQISKIFKGWVLILLLLSYFLIFVFFGDRLRVLVSMSDINILGYIASCFASILLIQLCKVLPKINVLSFIGEHSISFYFMSGALPNIFSIVIAKLLGQHTIISLLIVFICSITISYFATYILNRFTPWMFDLRLLRKNKETQVMPKN